jgi:hypothetical protein
MIGVTLLNLDCWSNCELNGNPYLHWFLCLFKIHLFPHVWSCFFITIFYNFILFVIKCCRNKNKNFICDIFNVIFYNPKNDVFMKSTTLCCQKQVLDEFLKRKKIVPKFSTKLVCLLLGLDIISFQLLTTSMDSKKPNHALFEHKSRSIYLK